MIGDVMKLIPLLILGAMLSNSNVLAEDICDTNAKSHYDLRICQGKRLQALDVKLNQFYKKALAAMPEDDEA